MEATALVVQRLTSSSSAFVTQTQM
jgi:hypothetical protein